MTTERMKQINDAIKAEQRARIIKRAVFQMQEYRSAKAAENQRQFRC